MDQALALTRRASELNPKYVAPFTVRGYHLLALGHYDEARKSLRQALHNQPLGEHAFEWLQRSAELRDASFMYLAFDPLLDNIRGDPRFAALMKQVGLPGVGLCSVREKVNAQD